MSKHSGYIRAVDYDGLMSLAVTHDLIIQLNCRPGDFLGLGSPLASIWPGDKVDDTLKDHLNDIFILGANRTTVQDILFLFNQLVEIALRALSPGVNDPFTAITCIDWLCARLTELSDRAQPSPYRYDQDEHLRVIAHPISYSEFVNAVFPQIRHYGCENVVIALHLLDKIGLIIRHTTIAENRAVLLQQAEQIKETAMGQLERDFERKQVQEKYEAVTADFTLTLSS